MCIRDSSTTTQKLCNWFIQQANAKGLVLTPVKLNHLVILADWWHPVSYTHLDVYKRQRPKGNITCPS